MFDSRSVLMISLIPRIISFSVIMYMAFKRLSLYSPEMKTGHKLICIVDVLGLAAMVIMKYGVIGNDVFFAQNKFIYVWFKLELWNKILEPFWTTMLFYG